MDRLTPEQSALLKQLEKSAIRYSDLNDADKNICRFLIKLKYAKATKTSHTNTGWGVASVVTEYDLVCISEAGKMYLVNENLSADQELFLRSRMASLKRIADQAESIADSAKKEAAIAKEDSAQAKKDATFSKVISIIAIVISIAAIIVPLTYGAHSQPAQWPTTQEP